MLVTYIDSTVRAHDQTLLAWLLRELPHAEELLVASGYFDAGILDWVEPELVALLNRGGEAHFAIGSNAGQTGREDLERLLALLAPHAPRAGLFVIHIPGGLYHAKTYVAGSAGRYSALVGSPNFTVASGLVNNETALILDAPTLEPPMDRVRASMLPTTIGAMPNAFPVGSVADLDALETMGAIGVPRSVTPRTPGPTTAAAARALRRLGRFPAAVRIVGTPPTTARPRGAIRPPTAAPPLPLPTPVPGGTIVVFVFSPNDLKQTGTREFSVPEGLRAWAGTVLGAPVRSGQGNLMQVTVLARLAAAPNSVVATPAPVRIWSAGASGGTHQDVRMVLGNALRSELENLSVILYGDGLQGGDIGVVQLPADPTDEPIRLTIFRRTDPAFAALDALAVRVGRQQKRQREVTGLPALAPWPY